MANDDGLWNDTRSVTWRMYRCPRRGCKKRREATTAPPCPVHKSVLMVRV